VLCAFIAIAEYSAAIVKYIVAVVEYFIAIAKYIAAIVEYFIAVVKYIAAIVEYFIAIAKYIAANDFARTSISFDRNRISAERFSKGSDRTTFR